MKIYYRGILAYTFDLSFWRTYLWKYTENISEWYDVNNKLYETKYWLNSTYQDKIIEYVVNELKDCLNEEKVVKDKELLDIFFNIFKLYGFSNGIVDKASEYIIYEKFYDKEGNIYGKEIITGCIFPIYNPVPSIKTTLQTGNYAVYLYVRPHNENKKLVRESVALLEQIAANQNEIDEYLGKKRIVKNRFIKKITNLAKQNTFSEEIVPFVQEEVVTERIKSSSEISIMENIEYLLDILKDKNHELYNQYKTEYEDVLNSENNNLTNKPLNISILTAIEAKIEFALKFNKTSTDSIMNYLSNLKVEYLENILTNSGKKTYITIDEIDKITELFLKQKSEYSILNQRNILKNIAVIYLLEIYENKDYITLESLENSYILDYLKWIILSIKAFIELDLVEEDILIEINNDIELSNVVDIIKKMKFKTYDEEDVKKIVKRNI